VLSELDWSFKTREQCCLHMYVPRQHDMTFIRIPSTAQKVSVLTDACNSATTKIHAFVPYQVPKLMNISRMDVLFTPSSFTIWHLTSPISSLSVEVHLHPPWLLHCAKKEPVPLKFFITANSNMCLLNAVY